MTNGRIAKGRRGGANPRLRHLVSGLLLLAIAMLVALHAAVLWERVAQGQLANPQIALRWVGAALLTAGLLVLRRLGVPLLWGRKALIFWLLVVLLHAGTASEAPALRSDPARLLFVLPASVAPVGLLLALLVTQLVRRTAEPRSTPVLRRIGDWVPAPRRGVLLALSPRAPPV